MYISANRSIIFLLSLVSVANIVDSMWNVWPIFKEKNGLFPSNFLIILVSLGYVNQF